MNRLTMYWILRIFLLLVMAIMMLTGLILLIDPPHNNIGFRLIGACVFIISTMECRDVWETKYQKD